MHTFTFSRVADLTKAIAAHAEDPHLAFIAGGTDLIGLMKDHVVLERGDLIISIEVPPRIEGLASYYLKVRDRQSYEFALVSTAAAVAMDGGRIRLARLAMGGVAHKPWRLTAAEAALRGLSLDDIEALRKAIGLSFIDARPLAQNGFKVELGQRVAF